MYKLLRAGVRRDLHTTTSYPFAKKILGPAQYVGIVGSRRTLVNGAQPQSNLPGNDEDADQNSGKPDPPPGWSSTLFKMFESSLTTLASVAVLGLIGYGYTRYTRPRIRPEALADTQ